MSEYQCYQWKKVGRSLTPKERREVSELSSHISVGPDSAEVTYHWGDFKHDPIIALELYFDVFLYEANWGTQRVAFRFDADTVDVEDLSTFVIGETIKITEKEDRVFLEVWFEENWIDPPSHHDYESEESDWWLEAFEIIYRQLMGGDYRALFLLWPKACELEMGEDDDFIVSLPEGMAQLEDEHQILAEFVGVDGGLIRQAAERSDRLRNDEPKQENLEPLLDKLPAEKKEAYLQRLLTEEATSVQIALRRELLRMRGRPRRDRSRKSVSFRELAGKARHAAELEARFLKEEKEKRRRDYLEELETRESEIWDRVHALVSEKKTKAYDESVLLLRGLEDLWTEREDREHFLNAVQLVADEFPRLTGFRWRLEEAGMLEPKSESIHSTYWREQWEKSNPLQREIDLNW
ncbi:MAG: hypothetical protein AAGA96_11530 [Verrucomicrobiota bacterium]